FFLSTPDQFPDDHRKIIFMLTNLSGNAGKWAQPLNQRMLNESDPDMTPPTLAKFITKSPPYLQAIRQCGVLHSAVQRPHLQFQLEQPYPGEPLPRWIEREHLPCNCVIR
ncbi:hypothetical protein VP01_13573g1, partial [Puccinia sorghi]